MKTTTAILVSMLLSAAALSAPPAQSAVPSFDAGNPQKAFRDMAEYLSRHGGRWKGPNPRHDPADPSSPSHFGLWFDWILEQQILELRIVGHRGDSTDVSSKSYWSWHPGKSALVYSSIGRNGLLAEGVTEFPDTDTFTTVTTEYPATGDARLHKDENFVVGADRHRNVSYRRDERGVWVKGGEYEWVRVRPGG